MCEQKETMPLRSICSFLARKTSSLDVMLLFVKPVYLLEPLCELLDTWRYEEDQGLSQRPTTVRVCLGTDKGIQANINQYTRSLDISSFWF